jgi:hypothetical protein|nr:MAG TPA: hypothetical protein [Caudoviricetes sp.]
MKQELVIDNSGAFGLIAGVDYVEESMDQSCPGVLPVRGEIHAEDSELKAVLEALRFDPQDELSPLDHAKAVRQMADALISLAQGHF